MAERYIAISIMARFDDDDTDQGNLILQIEKLLGCDGSEDPCPMKHFSLSAGTEDEMWNWIMPS